MQESKTDIKKINTRMAYAKNKLDLYARIANLQNPRMRGSLRSLLYCSAPGKKVTKIGWFLLWFPEPTQISNIVGLPMMGMGKLLDRYYNGLTIRHIGQETGKVLGELEGMLR